MKKVKRLSKPPYMPLEYIMVRFWPKIEVDDQSGCWLWTGTKDVHSNGDYGILRVMTPNGSKQLSAHRIALALRLGRWPDTTEHALHKCPNTRCCNPMHIRKGTPADNAADCRRDGNWKTHWVDGHDLAVKSVSDDTAREMIALYFGPDGNAFHYDRYRNDAKWTMRALAERYNVRLHVVQRCIKGVSKHSHHLSDNQRTELIELWKSEDGQGHDSRIKMTRGKWTAINIAKKFKVAKHIASCIVLGRTYRHIPRPFYHANWEKMGRIQRASERVN